MKLFKVKRYTDTINYCYNDSEADEDCYNT